MLTAPLSRISREEDLVAGMQLASTAVRSAAEKQRDQSKGNSMSLEHEQQCGQIDKPKLGQRYFARCVLCFAD